MAHPGQNKAKQKGSSRVYHCSQWFHMILQQPHESEHWVPDAEIHAIVKARTILLIVKKYLHMELVCKGRM